MRVRSCSVEQLGFARASWLLRVDLVIIHRVQHLVVVEHCSIAEH